MARVMSASAPVDGPAIPDPVTPAAASRRSAPSSAPGSPPRPSATGGAANWRHRLGCPPRGPLLLGLLASLMLVVGGFGAGGVLVRDPLLSNSALGFWRYGHGRELATMLIYGGVVLMAWAWVRLGREVLGRRAGGRAVLTTAAVWTVPMLFAPPLFTRDIFSYLAQGGLPLAGLDPYAVGPNALPGVFTDNVHFFWQDTPAPYGPLFILIAKSVTWLAGDNVILGIALMRLALLPGLALLVWALPELTRRLGGRVPVTLWIAVANPMMVINMVGGGHNDLLVVGLLAAGALVALRGGHVGAIALVSTGMAIKASAGIALPFLVLVWAAHLTGSRTVRIAKATAAGVGVFAAVFAVCTLVAGVGLGWLPALSAPSMIVNWMSIPTAVGQFTHMLVGFVVAVPMQPFVIVARIIGGAVLLAVACSQWWAARDGGPDAIRRCGIVLIAVALLSPATLPWYLSWGMAILAAVLWTPLGLQLVVFSSLMLIVVYYPNGEDALYDWPYLIACGLLAALAAASLRRPDPLRLSRRGARPTDAVGKAGGWLSSRDHTGGGQPLDGAASVGQANVEQPAA